MAVLEKNLSSQIHWYMALGHKTKANYIAQNVKDINELNIVQLETAKKALVWLVSKAPHTIDELADHFNLDQKLVCELAKLLKLEGKVKLSKGKDKNTTVARNY